MAELNHWADGSTFPVSDWQYNVANGDTRLGYHDWCKQQPRDPYRCPSCEGTDLRVECTVVLTFQGRTGEFTLESFEDLPGKYDLHDDAWTVCNNCEEEGKFAKFNSTLPEEIPPVRRDDFHEET